MERDMQFMTSLFGGSAGTLLNAAFALGIVIVLIVLGLWLLKLLTRATGRLGYASEKRLQVIDTATVDGKRKVMIIRRDNVEHVIMTGGPQDLLIESGIAVPEPQPMRRPAAARPAAAAPTQPADIATPITPERPVTRDTVDRLRDLARPAPLKPRVALRHTALLRPVGPGEKPVIPMGPELAVDNSAGPSADSARGQAGNETGGQVGLGGRNRFFRSVARDRS
ncbi:flagellar biosynthetic protein FliO [Devosia sp.]|uniref:flagellar biosynthetic protein FliO n=1 Tax=Devosia sp. TaxID=1871048 RepID=UPI0025C0D27D|nr:flagellar biosynthetic protein FliO [Devosia sp.]